jgi:hypothetical protein
MIQRISDIKEWWEHAEEESERRSKFLHVSIVPLDREDKIDKIISKVDEYKSIQDIII